MEAVLHAALVALLALMWGVLMWRPRPLPGLARPRPLLIGHRGVRVGAAENSSEALEAALGAGLDGVEFDVQRTQDGRLVLFHDWRFENGDAVSALTLEQALVTAPNLLLLEDALAICKDYPGTLVNIEIKALGAFSRGLEAKAARAALRSGIADRVLVSSFNPLALVRVRLVAPQLRTALLYSADLPLLLRGGWLARWLHADALHPHHDLVSSRLLAWAKRHGLAVNTWTVNEAERVAALIALEVDGIIADDPRAVKAAAGRE